MPRFVNSPSKAASFRAIPRREGTFSPISAPMRISILALALFPLAATLHAGTPPSVRLDVAGLTDGGVEEPYLSMTVEENIVLSARPALPTIPFGRSGGSTTTESRVSASGRLRLAPRASAEQGVQEWRVTVKQGEHVLETLRGDGALPRLIDWNPRDSGVEIDYRTPLEFRCDVFDSSGAQGTAIAELGTHVVVRRRHRLPCDADQGCRVTVALFPYNSDAPLPGATDRADLLRSALPEGACVRVEGGCDGVGSAARNESLAQMRAEWLATLLRDRGVRVSAVTSRVPPTPASDPDAQQYDRAATVIVESPCQ